MNLHMLFKLLIWKLSILSPSIKFSGVMELPLLISVSTYQPSKQPQVLKKQRLNIKIFNLLWTDLKLEEWMFCGLTSHQSKDNLKVPTAPLLPLSVLWSPWVSWFSWVWYTSCAAARTWTSREPTSKSILWILEETPNLKLCDSLDIRHLFIYLHIFCIVKDCCINWFCFWRGFSEFSIISENFTII